MWRLNEKVVVYCQKGKKLSEGAAAILRINGISAETLLDGHFGWRDAVNRTLSDRS